MSLSLIRMHPGRRREARKEQQEPLAPIRDDKEKGGIVQFQLVSDKGGALAGREKGR